MELTTPSGKGVAISALYLVLQTGAQASSPQPDYAVEAGTFGDDSVLNSSVISVTSGHDNTSMSMSKPPRVRGSGARCWVSAAHALVKAGDCSFVYVKAFVTLFLT